MSDDDADAAEVHRRSHIFAEKWGLKDASGESDGVERRRVKRIDNCRSSEPHSFLNIKFNCNYIICLPLSTGPFKRLHHSRCCHSLPDRRVPIYDSLTSRVGYFSLTASSSFIQSGKAMLEVIFSSLSRACTLVSELIQSASERMFSRKALKRLSTRPVMISFDSPLIMLLRRSSELLYLEVLFNV